MVQGQVFLKRGGLAFFLFNFSRFIIFTLKNYLFFAKLCYIFEEKLFFLPPQFYEKSHSKLPKNEPVFICKEGWCVRLRQKEGGGGLW